MLTNRRTSLSATLPSNIPELCTTSHEFSKLKRKHLQSETLYEDANFPTSNLQFLKNKGIDDIVWRRPHEICDGPKFFVDGASRFDIQQGSLGDCWFLSTLSSLTMREDLFSQVVPSDQTFDADDYAGIFHFRFWRYGIWVDIIIDDRLPVLRDNTLIFSHASAKNEFWSALIEKAYAKFHGSYEILEGGLPAEAMQDFTGGFVQTVNLNLTSPDIVSGLLLHAFSSRLHTMVACGIFSQSNELLKAGLSGEHAYTVSGTVIVNKSKCQLVRIRNPWGNSFEWNGPWSDGSKEWEQFSETEKSMMGYKKRPEGEFWMALQDFIYYFEILQLCFSTVEFQNDDWDEHYFRGSWTKKRSGGCLKEYRKTFNKNPKYEFRLRHKGKIFISLMEMNSDRGVNSSLGFELYQIPENKMPFNTEFISRNDPLVKNTEQFSGFREESCKFELGPGRYSLVVCKEKPKQVGNYYLRVFSKRSANLTFIQNDDENEENAIIDSAKLFKTISDKNETIDWTGLQSILLHYYYFDDYESTDCLKYKFVCGFSNVNDKKDEFLKQLSQTLIILAGGLSSNERITKEQFGTLELMLGEWQKTFMEHAKSPKNKLTKEELTQAVMSFNLELEESYIRKYLKSFKNSMALGDFIHLMATLRLKEVLTKQPRMATLIERKLNGLFMS